MTDVPSLEAAPREHHAVRSRRNCQRGALAVDQSSRTDRCVKVGTEDLTQLSPKRLERRLEQLAREALPCRSAIVFDGSPSEGLTVGLRVDSQGRRDVLDLARVLEIEPNGYVFSAWALLSPNRSHPYWRLLLRVHFERPVLCSFVVRLDIRDHPSDPLRATLPLLLAADRFALGFDSEPREDERLLWVSAPAARDCVLDVLAAVGVS